MKTEFCIDCGRVLDNFENIIYHIYLDIKELKEEGLGYFEDDYPMLLYEDEKGEKRVRTQSQPFCIGCIITLIHEYPEVFKKIIKVK